MTPTGHHPYQDLVIPSKAPFELCPSPLAGWGVFATRNIDPDELVLSEHPLFSPPECPKTTTEEELEKTVARLPDDKFKQLNLLRICKDGDKDQSWNTLIEVFSANNFTIGADLRSRQYVQTLQVLASRFNHSCVPNLIVRPCRSAGISLYAIHIISPGMELTFDYGSDRLLEAMTRSERHAEVNMICKCPACTLDPRAQADSDARRRMIRGLYHLIFGKDMVNGNAIQKILVPQESQILYAAAIDRQRFVLAHEEINLNNERVLAARESRMPLTTRLVYCVLACALMQAERALTRATHNRMWQIMNEAYRHLQNSATRKKTGWGKKGPPDEDAQWREEFLWVSDMFGRVDGGDVAGNAALDRMIPRLFR